MCDDRNKVHSQAFSNDNHVMTPSHIYRSVKASLQPFVSQSTLIYRQEFVLVLLIFFNLFTCKYFVCSMPTSQSLCPLSTIYTYVQCLTVSVNMLNNIFDGKMKSIKILGWLKLVTSVLKQFIKKYMTTIRNEP